MKRYVTITDGMQTKTFRAYIIGRRGPQRTKFKVTPQHAADDVLNHASVNEGFVPSEMRVTKVWDEHKDGRIVTHETT